jgi:SIR2-like domain
MAQKCKIITPARKQHTCSTVTDGDWKDLIWKIEKGQCTPFLGAGANLTLLPSAAELAKMLAVDSDPAFPFDDKKSDLPSVAQFLAITKQENRWPKDKVAELFQDCLSAKKIDHILKESHPLGLLADLPFNIFMTTNYDDLLFRVLSTNGKTPVFDVCPWSDSIHVLYPELVERRKRNRGQILKPTPKNPVVFHLHGHYQYPISMVLTEDDYYRFIVAMTQPPKTKQTAAAMIPASIQAAARRNMLLFIGYSFNDPNFWVLFRSLFVNADESDRSNSIAIQLPADKRRNPDAEEYLREYYLNHKIKLFYEDAKDFVFNLVQRWGSHHDRQYSGA